MRDHWFIPKVLLVFVITCMIFAVFYKGFDIYFSKEMKDHIAGKALFDQKNGKNRMVDHYVGMDTELYILFTRSFYSRCDQSD